MIEYYRPISCNNFIVDRPIILNHKEKCYKMLPSLFILNNYNYLELSKEGSNAFAARLKKPFCLQVQMVKVEIV